MSVAVDTQLGGQAGQVQPVSIADTNLMFVLLQVGGYLQEPHTFARICGYVEQSDIHSPRTTVREALVVSATLR